MTTTGLIPSVAASDEGTVAESCVSPSQVVVSGVDFQYTVEPDMKFEPVTASVNPGPESTSEGVTVVIAGTGGAATVNVRELEGTGPGFAALMITVPGVVSQDEGTVATNWVAL